jgi:hypothetical protein
VNSVTNAAKLAADVFGDDSSPNNQKRQESQATAIVRLVTDADAELWHTPAGDGYFTISVNGHREHHALNSRGCRDYLTRLFYVEKGKVPGASAMQDAIATLNGMARFDGDQHDVHVRVAGDERDEDERLFLDLCDSEWRIVEIVERLARHHYISRPIPAPAWRAASPCP